jgi:hypothetical protein
MCPAALVLAGCTLLFPGYARASYIFQNIVNTGDPAFNQELAINSSGEIAGYFGDGAIVFNNGYTVVPPYGPGKFTAENFPSGGEVQTQVTGINNAGDTVGFWVDTTGANHGFTDFGGTFISYDAPSPDPAVPTFTQFLGVNNLLEVAGFDTEANGNNQAFTFSGGMFTSLTPPNSTSAAATDVNNSGEVSGFETSSINGDTYGFLDSGGVFKELLFPGSTFTQFLGLNNTGLVVGVYQDSMGNNHGLLYNASNGTWQTEDDPFAVTGPGNGTTINGINDAGQLVGFYVNASGATIGLLANPTPEPAPYVMIGCAALLAGSLRLRRKAPSRS